MGITPICGRLDLEYNRLRAPKKEWARQRRIMVTGYGPGPIAYAPIVVIRQLVRILLECWGTVLKPLRHTDLKSERALGWNKVLKERCWPESV